MLPEEERRPAPPTPVGMIGTPTPPVLLIEDVVAPPGLGLLGLHVRPPPP